MGPQQDSTSGVVSISSVRAGESSSSGRGSSVVRHGHIVRNVDVWRWRGCVLRWVMGMLVMSKLGERRGALKRL